MPTYQYRCDKCHHQAEIFQSIMDEPLSKCPDCGQDAMKRMISGGAGIIFKGSGFYSKDYGGKNASDGSSS